MYYVVTGAFQYLDWKYESNSTCPGNDIKEIFGSASECNAACLSDETCKGVAYFHKNGIHSCKLKSKLCKPPVNETGATGVNKKKCECLSIHFITFVGLRTISVCTISRQD